MNKPSAPGPKILCTMTCMATSGMPWAEPTSSPSIRSPPSITCRSVSSVVTCPNIVPYMPKFMAATLDTPGMAVISLPTAPPWAMVPKDLAALLNSL